MNIIIEIEHHLTNDILSSIEELNQHSKTPNVHTNAFFIKCFNKFLLNEWKPLFIKIIKKEKNQVIGILPLMYQDIKKKGILPYRTIKFFSATNSDFNDIYAKQESREIVIKESLEWLSKNFKWQRLILDDLLIETNIIQHINNYLIKNRINHEIKKGKYYYIDLKNSLDEIKNNFNKKFVKRNIANATNRLNKSGAWKVSYNPSLSAEQIMDKILPVHTDRQISLDRSSRFLIDNFYKANLKIFDYYLSKNELCSYWLNYKNKDIAYMIGFKIDNIFYWWNTGFLSSYSRYSPGRILLYHAIMNMKECKVKELNFMRGESDYKSKWTKSFRENYRFIIKNNDNYSRLIHALS